MTNTTGIPAGTLANPMFNTPDLLPIGGMLATLLLTLYLAFFVFPVDRKSKAAI